MEQAIAFFLGVCAVIFIMVVLGTFANYKSNKCLKRELDNIHDRHLKELEQNLKRETANLYRHVDDLSDNISDQIDNIFLDLENLRADQEIDRTDFDT